MIGHEGTKQNYEQEKNLPVRKYKESGSGKVIAATFTQMYVPLRGLADIIQPYDDMNNLIGHLIDSLSASRSY